MWLYKPDSEGVAQACNKTMQAYATLNNNAEMLANAGDVEDSWVLFMIRKMVIDSDNNDDDDSAYEAWWQLKQNMPPVSFPWTIELK